MSAKANNTAKKKTAPESAAPAPVELTETEAFKSMYVAKLKAGLTKEQARECAIRQIKHNQAQAAE